jgi:hypothetical protein
MMDQLAMLDPYLVLALSMGLLLTLCVAILFLMRDSEWVPPRVVSRPVWCAARRQRATVQFVEHVRTGLVSRSVHRCSLLAAGSSCDEACCAVHAA